MKKLQKDERQGLEEIIRQNKAVGASTAIISRGCLVDLEVFGFRNSRTEALVETSTRFQAASISKAINAVAILVLVNRGTVSLEAPVNTYMSRWQLQGEFGNTVTIKQLLSHSGGTTVHGFKGYGSDDPLPDTIDILQGNSLSNSPGVVSKFLPGDTYKYSGGGTTILQALIEDVTHTQYEDFISANVFKPLNMSRSCYDFPIDSDGFSCAHGAGGNPIRGHYRRHPEKAAAGLWTTPEDLAAFLIDLYDSLNGSTQSILPRKLTELMMTPVVADSGLGLFLIRKNLISHSGANYGFRSYFVLDRVSGNGVVAMSNSERGARTPARLMTEIGNQRQWNDFFRQS